jgi:hypothetical protein
MGNALEVAMNPGFGVGVISVVKTLGCVTLSRNLDTSNTGTFPWLVKCYCEKSDCLPVPKVAKIYLFLLCH